LRRLQGPRSEPFPTTKPRLDFRPLRRDRPGQGLRITTDELLGVKPPKVERINDDSEARRMWKRFQMVSVLPERDQKAVIRLINSLVAVGASRKNGSVGEHNGR